VRGYYFITDAGLSLKGNLHDVRKAVEAGVRFIQYRNKNAGTRLLYEEACRMKEICSGRGVKLIINDRIDIALASGADGVHIGQEDLPYPVARKLLGRDKIIGVTVHSLAEALEAMREGADYLGVSPIFATATKSDAGTPCGLETLKRIRQACAIPLAVIGGIDLTNVDTVIETGADMVCAISAVVTQSDPVAEILKFQRKFKP
jgi:thiamine-phosphate pyrophosphorylase